MRRNDVRFSRLPSAIVLALTLIAGSLLTSAPVPTTVAQQPVTLTTEVDQPGPRVDPMFYGLMTEEINSAYDGGIYAELIRNYTFRDNAQNPVRTRTAGPVGKCPSIEDEVAA